MTEPPEASGPESALALDRVRAAGATLIRTSLSWFGTAPATPARGFRPADPNDRQYDWSAFDKRVRLFEQHGLEPIAAINDVPNWARLIPDPVSPPHIAPFAAFMRAAAKRYSGATPGVPRVRYWEIWIEPNVDRFFSFKAVGGESRVAAYYAAMVNAATLAVRAVSPDARVIAGGLSPFTVSNPDIHTIGPFVFMRQMLCVQATTPANPTCASGVAFDIWDHHPYTSGGPYHKALNPDDASLGDLPRMNSLLLGAYRAHHIVAPTKPLFWVTEFSWDTNPPDPTAVPLALHARWVAEALDEMWQAGVTLVTWLQLRDEGPPPQFSYQSGLWFRGDGGLATDSPKPALTAFRFPFVAYRRGERISYWGRTPWGKPGRVIIEQNRGTGWRQVASVVSDRFGIFRDHYQSHAPRGEVRTRLSNGSLSLGFSLVVPPNENLAVRPFGA